MGGEVIAIRMGIQAVVVDRESNGSKNKQLKNYGQKNNSAQRTLGGGGGEGGGSRITKSKSKRVAKVHVWRRRQRNGIHKREVQWIMLTGI